MGVNNFEFLASDIDYAIKSIAIPIHYLVGSSLVNNVY